eukprot:7898322-Lingulodinium_polyedra.AAC.1
MQCNANSCQFHATQCQFIPCHNCGRLTFRARRAQQTNAKKWCSHAACDARNMQAAAATVKGRNRIIV